MMSVMLVAGVVLFAGACSSSDNKSSGSSSSKSSTSTRSESSDCLSAAATYSRAGGALDGVLAGKGVDLDTAAQEFYAYANVAPSAIREDMRTVVAGYKAVVQAIQDLGYQAGQVPSADQAQKFQEAYERIDTDETKAADDRISAFFDNNCQG